MANWFFFYQREGKESHWTEALAERREAITREIKPAFSTILDLSFIPDDNDWSKVRYRGNFYADFDAGDDLPFVCDQFKSFLGKLHTEFDFDLTQASLYASGGKGFHIEIPQECFISKISRDGTSSLAYIYREMAQNVIVDTLDLNVYTGKRGRMWRTPNIKRENGNYKVPITLDEALEIDSHSYAAIIKSPRREIVPTPPHCNPKFALLFERSKDKVQNQMRGKKKRTEKANEILRPWKSTQKTPPTIEKIMRGEDLADGVGFQNIAMQLAIYAVSVGLNRKAFLDGCAGLVENHVSDSYRYNTNSKRLNELSRMFDYMEQDTLYDFEVGPIGRLLKPGTSMPDLGSRAEEETHTTKGEMTSPDLMRGVRKGFIMNKDGMFKRNGENTEPVCRAYMDNVTALHDLEVREFIGYELDIRVGDRRIASKTIGADSLTSANAMRKFFGGLQVSYQGGEPETSGLLDVLAERSEAQSKVYAYPREGFFIIDHPEKRDRVPVKCYLTQDTFISSIDKNDPDYFRLRYRPSEAASTYLIDIHTAPNLKPEMASYIHDLFSFNRRDAVVNMVGWYVAAHYRSVYLRLFHQFPILQVFGEAGSGKSQTVSMLSRLHWYRGNCGLATASSYTNFTLDNKVNTSHSAPAIIDEYKPRELRAMRGKYEKVKDVMKNSYIGGDTGNRGTINKNGETSLAVIKSRCAAPMIFMGESLESETAIVERCVMVKITKAFQTPDRTKAFKRLHESENGQKALSAIGRAVVEHGFGIVFDDMYNEVTKIFNQLKDDLPLGAEQDGKQRAERMTFNLAVVIHGWLTLKKVLQKTFGAEFDAVIDEMISEKYDTSKSGQAEDVQVARIFGRSEISKVISQIALLSRDTDRAWEMRVGKDYLVGDGWVEFKVEKAFGMYRMYCATTHQQALFDNIDGFMVALSGYSPCIDHNCAASELREDGSSESIMRFDAKKLSRDGVQMFK